jgi:regulator of protease activity HflC (stomatin/prohibitin superfamily)
MSDASLKSIPSPRKSDASPRKEKDSVSSSSSRSTLPRQNSRAHTKADSDSDEDFTNDPKAVFDRNKAKKGDNKEKIDDLANRPAPTPSATRFSEDLPEEVGTTKTYYKLQPGETFIQGLKKLDSSLVSKAKSDLTVFAAHTVLEGEIGKALHHGRTKFYGPGNYGALGPGKDWLGTEKLRKDGDDIVVHQDVTLISLAENQLAVIQVGKTQYPIGSGQYIIRHPTHMEGKAIDIQKLGSKHMTTVITEGTKQTRDPATGKVVTIYEQGKRELNAGWTAKAGAITLIRPEPGFHYVVQQSNGYRLGPEYTYARGEESFLGFMNFLQQSRTTKRFSFFSLDRQRAEMTVQLTWIMKDGIKWLTKGRAYEDPFDMLEEKAEAFFRDAIGAMDHQKALKEKSDGFNTIELEIFTKLSNSASSLGAKLLSIEVRELSFPTLEAQEVTLAAKEAETRTKKLEAQREIELRKLEDEKIAALEAAKADRARLAAKAEAEQKKIEEATALSMVEAESVQALARQKGKAEEEKARLKSDQEVTKLKGETAKLIAQNDAEVMAVKERARNTLALERAQTEAKASEAMAKVLVSNPTLLELKKMEIWAEVEKERYRTIAAFAANPDALLPEALSRDLLRMRHGANPQEFLAIGGTSSLPPFQHRTIADEAHLGKK